MTCFLSEGHGTLQLDLNFFTSLQKMIPDASGCIRNSFLQTGNEMSLRK